MRGRLIRIGLSAILICSIGLGAFWAGRLTAPAPRFDASSSSGQGDALAEAWADFIRAQEESIALFRSDDFFGSAQERAEAYRGVLYALVGSIKSGALMDPDHPRFMPAVDWTSKSGLDNPDNAYSIALIRDDAEYRIKGTRGTARNLIFQLVVGQPGVRGAGTSTNVSVLDARDMDIQPDGSFEILVSRTNPAGKRNWLRVDDGAETLLVRHSHSDWTREQAGRLEIEKIGAEGLPVPPLTPERMARSLRDVATSLFDRNATWLNYAHWAWSLMPRNGISKARPSQGGLVGQYSAFGTWELEEDQALILTTHPSKASYQGIELGNLWFVSLDYETRTSSLTTDQAYLGPDGRYHFVISASDPRIQNWLDTEGHRRGLVMLRWQGLEAPLPADRQPNMRLVPLDRIHEALPAGIPEFGHAERREQIRLRREHVQRRAKG
jgi:hypothetical protein